MEKKFKRIKLRPIILSDFEKDAIKQYCKDMGYVYDEHPPQLDGQYPLIAKDDTRQRLGFIQRINGSLKLVYQQKKMDLDTSLKLNELSKLSKVKPGTRLHRFLAGVVDFDYSNDYKPYKQ